MVRVIGFDTIELPPTQLQEMREQIWAAILQPDKRMGKQEYARMLRAKSHPTAIFRGRVVRGTTRLQHRLNLLIASGRVAKAAQVLLIGLGFFVSLWLLLAIPPIFLIDLFVLNHVQTKVNVEIAARLFLLDRMMEEDEVFCQRVLDALEAKQ
ncbi:MAG: hypothetical protein ACYTAQ_01775 [Planctomycetota bacterium]